MARRLFLHVGTPKSGTTYLQAILWHNADRLKADGLLLPGRFQTHYAAAKGVTSRSGQRRRTRVGSDEAWPRLTSQVNRWSEDALISHELLAPASREQALQAKASIDGSELHLVLTARALHHQVPASWQEQVKGGLPTPFEVFLNRVRDERAKGAWFWDVQDLVSITERWGEGIAPDRIHIVTVPPDRSDPTLLWRRYASVFGIDPSSYDTSVPVKNASLGLVECELLRRVHAVRDERFTDGDRHAWTRKLLASQVLARRDGHRIQLPDSMRSWVATRAADMVGAVRDRGYHVVGDLTDLTRRPPTEPARSVDSVSRAELAEAAAWTIDQLHEHLRTNHPDRPRPDIDPEDGVAGILELLEHIRAYDSGVPARPGSATPASRRPGRLRQVFTPSRAR